MLRVTSDGLK